MSPLAKEFLSWHERLMHIPFSDMFKLCKRSILPKNSLSLEKNPPLCMLCQFRCAHERHWQFKGKCLGSIRKPSHNQPGSCVLVDQIISAQPGFIPQMSGKLLRDRIWEVTLFIDYYTDFLFSYLQTSTSKRKLLRLSILSRSKQPHITFASRSIMQMMEGLPKKGLRMKLKIAIRPFHIVLLVTIIKMGG